MKPAAPLPPGGTGLPFVGEALAFLLHPFAFYEKRFRRHGPVFRTKLARDEMVCFATPGAFTLFSDERYFSRSAVCSPKSMLRQLFGADVVACLDGARHVVRKRLLLQALDQDHLAACLPLIESVVDLRLRRWAQAGEILWAEELGELAFALTDSLFAGAEPQAQHGLLQRRFQLFLHGTYCIPLQLPFTAFGRALRARKELLSYFQQAIARRRASPGGDVLSALLRAEVEGVRLSNDEAAVEILHAFYASCLGMHAMFAGLCYALTLYPECRDKLRNEVKSLPVGALTPESMGSLEYLDWVVKEVKRFYPATPNTFFAQTVNPVPMEGVEIPTGWMATGCPHHVLHDPHIFEEPKRFDPERFAPGRLQAIQEQAFVPQGGGPLVEGHRCAGEQLTTLLLKVLAVRLLQGWTWQARPQDFRIDMRHMPPLPRDRLRVRFERMSQPRARRVRGA
jgi:cytochrome P450